MWINKRSPVECNILWAIHIRSGRSRTRTSTEVSRSGKGVAQTSTEVYTASRPKLVLGKKQKSRKAGFLPNIVRASNTHKMSIAYSEKNASSILFLMVRIYQRTIRKGMGVSVFLRFPSCSNFSYIELSLFLERWFLINDILYLCNRLFPLS